MGVIDGHATDKHENGYVPRYEALALPEWADVCEVGVRDGGSLALWRAMFPRGRVVGVDIDPSARWPEHAIRVVADQTDPHLPDLVDPDRRGFDLIVDDASHLGGKTDRTFDLLWPLVKPGRWYVIEDWQAEQMWPDTYPAMTDACTTQLLRVTHWRGPHRFDSVTYWPGMLAVRKAAG